MIVVTLSIDFQMQLESLQSDLNEKIMVNNILLSNYIYIYFYYQII